MNVELQWTDSSVHIGFTLHLCCGLFYEQELVYLSFTQNTSGILYMHITKS